MATHKEQLKLHYERQRTLIDEIKIMRSDLQTEQKLTTRFRKQRDKYKAERQALFAKVAPDIESQDSQKDFLEKLRKRRAFLRRQAQRTDGPVFKILTAAQLEQLTLVELKFHLYELEFMQQTSTLSREDEEILIEEIKRVEDQIAYLEKKNEAIVADYLGNIPETKEKLELEITEIDKKIAKEEADRKEIREKVQQIYSRIKPLKEEEDKAHQEFVVHLQKIDELKALVQAKQEELDSLKGKISKIKKLIAEEEHKQVYGKIEEKIEALLKKKDKGEDLSPEEQEFLMSYGHVPF
ncbi:MAG: hypothetical protein JSV04_13795 [Candidatus Heimdallarchaeota archaeon]|nr:MAG: hypothetical protein JSV04_13795 [Candidatus Heimdallarchaeota archaeon]